MAAGSSRLPLLLLALFMAASFLSISPASAQLKICGVDVTKMRNACKSFVEIKGPQKDPSKACCAQLKNVNVPCLCDNLPPGIEDTISIEKAMYVVKFCGASVPKGTKCGSYTVPPLL